jgi:hypothetical protein
MEARRLWREGLLAVIPTSYVLYGFIMQVMAARNEIQNSGWFEKAATGNSKQPLYCIFMI